MTRRVTTINHASVASNFPWSAEIRPAYNDLAELNDHLERSMAWPEPVRLDGNVVSVVPLTQDHHDDLVEAAGDGELHRLWYTMVPQPHQVGAEIERRLAQQAAGSMVAFAIVDRASGRAVGMTTYMNIDAANRRLEIGSTWYRKAMQRTGLNTECKFLMLRHAFEEIDCIAVEFRTHFINHQSRRAIERLGAKLDGNPAQPHDHGERDAARLLRLLDPQFRMAHGESQPDLANGAPALVFRFRTFASPFCASECKCLNHEEH